MIQIATRIGLHRLVASSACYDGREAIDAVVDTCQEQRSRRLRHLSVLSFVALPCALLVAAAVARLHRDETVMKWL